MTSAYPSEPIKPDISGADAGACSIRASSFSRRNCSASGSAPYVLVPATYLAPGTVMEGTLRSKGDVEIAGTFKGDIISEGDVMGCVLFVKPRNGCCGVGCADDYFLDIWTVSYEKNYFL